MSRGSARLFSWVQSARFYEALHRQAVQLLPPGQATHPWVDVGCGPGLVTRLAAAHGYRATGIDIDPAMVRQARRTVGNGTIQFLHGGLDTLAPLTPKAEVISAASLLAVLPDRPAALRQLLAGLAPGGTLLLIEPDLSFTPTHAARYRQQHRLSLHEASVLWLWARTRRPERAVRQAEVTLDGWITTRHPLLNGLVNAWLLRRA